MAKKKSIRVLSEEMKVSNESISQSISSLEQRMSFMESTCIEILNSIKIVIGEMNRIEKLPADVGKVDTKSDKIIKNPKIKKEKDNTTAGVLTNLYNFLTKKSDKEDKERKSRKSFEKEKTKEIEKRYQKVFKSSGFNFKKKKGLIGKAWAGLKWTTIGLALGGLVWMFKEEISSAADSIKNSIKGFGDFLKTKFESIRSIFDSISKLITESPIYKMIKERFNSFSESITGEQGGIRAFVNKKFDNLIEMIETTSKTIYEDISAWIKTLVDPIVKFMEHPYDFIKNNSNTLSKMGLIMASGPIGMAAKATYLGGAAADIAEKSGEMYSRKAYGNESYEKMRNFLDSIPDQLSKRVVAEFLSDKNLYAQRFLLGSRSSKMTEDDKVRIVDLMFQYPELKERLADSRTNTRRYFNKVEDVVPNALEGMGIGETREEAFARQTGVLSSDTFKKQKREEIKEIDLSVENWALSKIIQNLDGYEFVSPEKSYMSGITVLDTKTNTKINSVKDPIEFGRLLAKASFYEYVGEKKQEIKNKFNELKSDIENHPWVKTASEELENIENKSKALKQKYVPKVTEATATVSKEITSAYQDADTPDKKVSATVGLLGQGIGAAGDLFVESSAPSMKKIDLSNIIDKSFEFVGGSFNKAAELSSKISQPGGFEELLNQMLPTGNSDEIGSLLPELKKDTISPDPSEDPNNIWGGIRDAFGSNISNNVLNTGKTTSKTHHQGSIACRMNNPSFQNSSILNACRP